MLFMALGSFGESIAKLIGPFAVSAGSDSWICQGQAALLLSAQIASNIWAHYISMVFFLVLMRSWAIEDAVKKMNRVYMVASVLVPVVIALPLLFAQSVMAMASGPVYSDAIMWCWLSSDYIWIQAVTSYGPLVLIVMFNTVVFTMIGIKIYRVQYNLGSSSSSAGRMSGYVVGVSVYMAMFLVSWVPGLVYCVHQLYFDGGEIFALLVLRTLGTPLRGVLTLVLYWLFAKASNGRDTSKEPSVVSYSASHGTPFAQSVKGIQSQVDNMGQSAPIASSPVLGRFHESPLSHTIMYGTPEFERRMLQQQANRKCRGNICEPDRQWQRKASTLSIGSNSDELSHLYTDTRRPSAISTTTLTTTDDEEEPFSWLRRNSEEAIRQRDQQQATRKPSAHAILLERVKEEDA